MLVVPLDQPWHFSGAVIGARAGVTEGFNHHPWDLAGEAEMAAWPQPAHALVMATDPAGPAPCFQSGAVT